MLSQQLAIYGDIFRITEIDDISRKTVWKARACAGGALNNHYKPIDLNADDAPY